MYMYIYIYVYIIEEQLTVNTYTLAPDSEAVPKLLACFVVLQFSKDSNLAQHDSGKV